MAVEMPSQVRLELKEAQIMWQARQSSQRILTTHQLGEQAKTKLAIKVTTGELGVPLEMPCQRESFQEQVSSHTELIRKLLLLAKKDIRLNVTQAISKCQSIKIYCP